VWYVGLELDELGAVDSKLRLLSHNRHNVLSVWDRDYLALQDPAAVGRGIAAGEHRELVTVPRILGHAFNPVSFLLARRGGEITDVQAEVHNTWGERHVYALARNGGDNAYESEALKAFYVSPFLPIEGQYRFELREDATRRLQVRIALDDGDGREIFSGGIDVQPMALTDWNLGRLLLTYPLVNLKTVAMIHWQGFKLWRRGVKFRAHPGRAGARGQPWPKGH
jgi:DUF1365 family protein